MNWGWPLFGWAVIRLVLTGVVSGITALSAAAWIVDKSVVGLSTASQNLNASMVSLTDTMRNLDNNIRSEIRVLQTEKQSLALEVAKEVAKIQMGAAVQDNEIKNIKDGINDIKEQLKSMRRSDIPGDAPTVQAPARGGNVTTGAGNAPGAAVPAGPAPSQTAPAR